MNLLHAPSNHSPNENGTTLLGWDDQWVQITTLLAHEVRTPLTNINLSVEMMEPLIENDEQKMYMDIISRNSWRIAGLVDDLLNYKPVGEEALNKYSARRLLDEVLGMAADRIFLKEIVIQKEYFGEDCELLIHPYKMKVALNNIIVNAIEAMTMERRFLTLKAGHADEGYMITIEDTGHGIGKEDLPHIFTPYYTKKPTGVGLGLFTTYGILVSNHVQVSVESEEGSGTRFVLVFQDLA
jgi:signal transduction histidine kinase